MALSAGSSHKRRGTPFTEINITPLTDIFLVLLIMMMVLAPMFDNSRQDIQMPVIRSGQGMEDQKITLELTQDGTVYAMGEKVAPADLAERLSQLQQTRKQNILVVRADKATKSSEVLKVFEAASQAGFEKLTIAGEPLSSQRQRELKAPDASPRPEEANPS